MPRPIHARRAFNASLSFTLPSLLMILQLLAGVRDLPVFIFTDTRRFRTTYHIGAWNYSNDSNFGSSASRINYTALAWPSPVSSVPQFLVVHFALAVALVVYVFLAGMTFLFVKKGNKVDSLLYPPMWRRIIARILALIVLGSSVADAVVCCVALGWKHDFHPTVLGYFVIIGGITLSFPWLYICWTAEHPISAGRYEIAEQRVLEEGPTRVQSRASKMPEKR